MIVGSYARASDTGKKRRRNEDSFVVAPPLFGVADGMGGAQAGEVASKLAASAIGGGEAAGLEGRERVDAMIREANRRIHELCERFGIDFCGDSGPPPVPAKCAELNDG